MPQAWSPSSPNEGSNETQFLRLAEHTLSRAPQVSHGLADREILKTGAPTSLGLLARVVLRQSEPTLCDIWCQVNSRLLQT